MADLSDFELINISGLPSGTAAGSNLLAQDDGSNVTKITINQAVAASQAMQQVNNKIGSTALPTTAQTLTGAIAEHEADLTALNGKFVIEQKTVPVPDIQGGSTGWVSASVAKSGYNAIGVVGWYCTDGSANTWLFPYSMKIRSNTTSVALRNMAESQYTASGVTLLLDVLYQKA